MKHNLKRTFLLILALILALAALAAPAMAAISTTTSTVSFQKHLEFEGARLNLPDEGITFSFSIEPAEAVAGNGSNPSIKAGVGSPVIETVTFTNDDFTSVSNEKSKNVKIDFSGIDWPSPGIYAYKITENASSSIPSLDQAITFDMGYTRERWLYVMVVNTDDMTGKEIEAAVMTTQAKTPENDASDKKIDVLKNVLETHNLYVEKEVVGKGANKDTDEFNIVVNLMNCPLKGSFTTIKSKRDGTTEEGTYSFSGNGTTTVNIQLKDDEWVQFVGLPKSVSYTVSENLTDTDRADGYLDPFYTTDSGSRSTTAPSGAMTGDHRVEILNTKNVVTPTGVFMDYAPYALLVIVALAAAFVFLRKRGSNDDR